MIVGKLHFLNSLNFLPMNLKSMPKSFYLTCKKGCNPHIFNTTNNFDYVGHYLEPKFYGAGYISVDVRGLFLGWYEEQKHTIFCNKQEFLAYCMVDVNVPR